MVSPMGDVRLGSDGPAIDSSLWVDRHGDYLFRYAMSRLHNRDVAEELVQETFLAALQAGDNFAGRSSERTWFVGILRHKIVDHLQRRQRERPASEVGPPDEGEEFFDQRGRWKVGPTEWGDHPGASLERREFWETFRSCLSQLPHGMAAAFSLREMDRLGSNEICELLGVTSGNLRVLLYRARMHLRRCLETHWFRTKTDEV